MKIMHVLKHAQQGNGHVHVAVDLACAQADAGHHVAMVIAHGSYDDLLEAHGVRVVHVTEPTGKRSAARNTSDLFRLVRRERPDVLHAHMMSSAVAGFVVAKLTKTLLVTTVHNSFDGHSSLMRLGGVVVAVSEAERRHLLQRHFPARKTVTVLNGAVGSPREQLPLDDIGPADVPCVMTLSGLHPRKAVGDVIHAFARVHRDNPNWHLNIVGEGPDQPALESLVDSLGLGMSVRFLGLTRTPRYLLEAADVFVSASLAEPFGLSIAEARAAGCAVVATAVGGVPEVLEQGRAGLLVEPSDRDALVAALGPLLEDPQHLAEWQSRAREGSDRFSVRRMANDYEDVYARALGRGRKAP